MNLLKVLSQSRSVDCLPAFLSGAFNKPWSKLTLIPGTNSPPLPGKSIAGSAGTSISRRLMTPLISRPFYPALSIYQRYENAFCPANKALLTAASPNYRQRLRAVYCCLSTLSDFCRSKWPSLNTMPKTPRNPSAHLSRALLVEGSIGHLTSGHSVVLAFSRDRNSQASSPDFCRSKEHRSDGYSRLVPLICSENGNCRLLTV